MRGKDILVGEEYAHQRHKGSLASRVQVLTVAPTGTSVVFLNEQTGDPEQIEATKYGQDWDTQDLVRMVPNRELVCTWNAWLERVAEKRVKYESDLNRRMIERQQAVADHVALLRLLDEHSLPRPSGWDHWKIIDGRICDQYGDEPIDTLYPDETFQVAWVTGLLKQALNNNRERDHSGTERVLRSGW